jgi:hypothetical protein
VRPSQTIRIEPNTDLRSVSRVEGVRVLDAGERVKVSATVCEDSRTPLAVRVTPI